MLRSLILGTSYIRTKEPFLTPNFLIENDETQERKCKSLTERKSHQKKKKHFIAFLIHQHVMKHGILILDRRKKQYQSTVQTKL